MLMAFDIAIGSVLLWAALELLLGLKPLSLRPLKAAQPRYCIVCPAHDESAQIGPVAAALLASLDDRGRLLVVADNCTDNTAEVARQVGAEVVERTDADRRGKGYALDFARTHLSPDPPDVVVVVDADCVFSEGTAASLAAAADQTQGPAQARYLMDRTNGEQTLVAISNLAFKFKNLVRARGLQRLGGGITIQGTGIALPWPIYRSLDLATDDPVEDLNHTIQLAKKSVRVQLSENISIGSSAATVEGSITQRTRWEHGFVRTALRQALPLMKDALRTGSRHRLALAMHLLVPPLALLVLMCAALLATNVLVFFTIGTIAPFLFFSGCLAAFSLAIMLAWAVEGRDTVSGPQLLRVPLYIIWKLPIYLSLLAGRKTGWLRTPRD